MKINHITNTQFKGLYVIDGNQEEIYKAKELINNEYLSFYNTEPKKRFSELKDLNISCINVDHYKNNHIQYIVATNEHADSIIKYYSDGNIVLKPSNKYLRENGIIPAEMRKLAQDTIDEILRVTKVKLENPIQIYKAEKVISAIKTGFFDFVNGGFKL